MTSSPINDYIDKVMFYEHLGDARTFSFITGSGLDLLLFVLLVYNFAVKNKDLCKPQYVFFAIMALVMFLRLPLLILTKFVHFKNMRVKSTIDFCYSVYEYYLILFIPMCQTVITLNRVSALFNPVKHKIYWGRFKTLCYCVSLILIPLIGTTQAFLPVFTKEHRYWGNWTRNIGFFLCMFSVLLASISECRNVKIATNYTTRENTKQEKRLLIAVLAGNIGGSILFLCKVFQQYYFHIDDTGDGLQINFQDMSSSMDFLYVHDFAYIVYQFITILALLFLCAPIRKSIKSIVCCSHVDRPTPVQSLTTKDFRSLS